MPEITTTRECTQCAELIQASAKVCRFCGKEFPAPLPPDYLGGLRTKLEAGDELDAAEFGRVVSENQRLLELGDADEAHRVNELISASGLIHLKRIHRLEPDSEDRARQKSVTVTRALDALRQRELEEETQRQAQKREVEASKSRARVVVAVLIAATFAVIGLTGGFNATGSASTVRVQGCTVFPNSDGSATAEATVVNSGSSTDSTGVTVSLVWYGGTTSSHDGTYDVPPGSHVVGDKFDSSPGQTPVGCSARVGQTR